MHRECPGGGGEGRRAGEGAWCGGERWEGSWELAALRGTVGIPGGSSRTRLWQRSTLRAYRGQSSVCPADSGVPGPDPAQPLPRPVCRLQQCRLCSRPAGRAGSAGLWWCQSRASTMPGSWLCPCSQASSSVSAGRGPYRAPQTSGTTAGASWVCSPFPAATGSGMAMTWMSWSWHLLRVLGCWVQGAKGVVTSSAEVTLPQPHSVPPERTWWPQPGTSALEPPRPPSQGAASCPGAPGLAWAAQNILSTTSLSTGGVGVPPTRQSVGLWGTAHGRREPVA